MGIRVNTAFADVDTIMLAVIVDTNTVDSRGCRVVVKRSMHVAVFMHACGCRSVLMRRYTTCNDKRIYAAAINAVNQMVVNSIMRIVVSRVACIVRLVFVIVTGYRWVEVFWPFNMV